MARLSFECQDADGDRVTIHTSEAEIDELVNRYPELKRFLIDAGFTLVKPYQGRQRTTRQREKTVFDGVHCPKCGSEMWDNRARNAESGKRGPDFRCKNENCSGSTTDRNGNKWPFSLWAGQYEIAK